MRFIPVKMEGHETLGTGKPFYDKISHWINCENL